MIAAGPARSGRKRTLALKAFTTPKPRLMVVSHERSGTHFLMNSLASAFGYSAAPWLDFDRPAVDIDFRKPEAVLGFFRSFETINLATTIKSHHQVEFFAPCLGPLLDIVTILYVHRDPRDVMRSCRRFMLHWDWPDAPKFATCKEYIRARPSGRMLRYQMRQYPDMLARWQAHVEGWLAASRAHANVIAVPYERLDRSYPDAIADLGARLGLDVRSLRRPSRDRNVIAPTTAADPGLAENRFDDDDDRLFAERVGDTMRRLGYS